MSDQDDHDYLVSSLCDLTGVSAQQAEEYLAASGWNIDNAAAALFADQDEAEGAGAASSVPTSQPTVEPAYTGPRTLDGRPAPQYASSSSSSAPKRPKKKTGLATLSSLGSSHDHDEDEDDDDDDDEGRRPRDLFAGGEKSGLAVQDPARGSSDPKKLIDDIISKAKANANVKRPGNEPAAPAGPSSSRFRGSGQTLGGDGVESQIIPDPFGNPIPTARNDAAPQERVLHLWADGFSIDDGELHRFDDPENAADLELIRQGRAPLHLMNVSYDQPVDVKLQQHQEDYRRLPRVYRPFGGEGRRLGSPVPGDGNTAPAPAPTSAAAPASGSNEQPWTGVDESQPTLMLRIQMPDGTRLPARFNTTNTVDDVYQYVQRTSSATKSRPWVLATTFPNKEHTDKSLVLGEMPEFKKGGTAVVKWA